VCGYVGYGDSTQLGGSRIQALVKLWRDFECLGNLQFRSKVLRLFRCCINYKTCIAYFSSAFNDDSSQRKVFFVLAMKTHVSRSILNLGTTDEGERLTSRPDRFNPQERTPVPNK
jgi:hypothetical protein